MPGGIEVNTFGGELKTYQVQLDPKQLLARGISVTEVFEALQRNNSNAGGGYIERNGQVRVIRAQGLVGDQADGYLGIVSGASAALQGQVAQINAERAQQYAQIAKQQGTTATAVGAITGQQLYSQTPSGQYFRDANGSWIKKP